MARFILILILLSTTILFGQTLAGPPGAAESTEAFSHTFVLFLHQLLVVYWIGPDQILASSLFNITGIR